MSQAKEVSRKSCRVLIKEIYKKDRAKVEKLLLRGANVNGADYNGNTPLHHAVATRDVGMIRLIMEHGGDVNAVNDSHIRPYEVALNDSFYEGLELLLKNNRSVTNAEELASKLPRHIVNLIYDNIDLQARNSLGHAVLHIATANNEVDAVRRLLARGADIAVKTAYRKETALHLVVSHEIAELLLNHGASVNAPDRYTCTPLSAVAVKSRKNLTRDEQSRIIELLIDRGAGILDVLVIAELHLDYNGVFDGMHGLKDVLKYQGLREDEQSFQKRINRGEFSVFYRQVLAEVAKLKKATFYCNVSFYEFLRKSWRRQNSYIDDLRVARAIFGDDGVVADDLATKFPLYYAILKRYIDAAIRRNEFRENAAIAVTIACPRLESLHFVIDKILMFLDRQDMKVITEACSVSQTMR